MKRSLFFFLSVLGPVILLAQSSEVPIVRDSRVINPVPPAPEMATLGKYGDISFERSKGTAAMSIPIYTITYDGVTIPLQLQYSSNGFQPSNVGSYLGMHWSLTGIGGISRSIKGQPDEDGYLVNDVDEDWIDSVHATHGSFPGQSSLTTLNQGLDISQDAYTLSANDLNGQFFIDANKNFKFSLKNDLKLYHQVTYPGGGAANLKFWIRDTRGNRYEFDSTERTFVTSTNGYSRAAVSQDGVTAWKLTKIITAGGKTISFNYSSTTYVYNYSTASQDVYMSTSSAAVPPDATVYCGCSENDEYQYGTNQHYYHTKLLTSITTGNETVEFNYADDNSAANYKKKLTEIVVKDRSGLAIKKFQFAYGYYSGNTRLKLTEFKVKSVVAPLVDSAVHKFTYFEDYTIPAPNTRALDGFKYFNGASNSHLIVSTHVRFLGTSADRIVRPDYAKQTLLDKVTYPTGGTTNFVYESNGNLDTNNIGPGLRVKKLINKNGGGVVTGEQEFLYRNFLGGPLMLNNVPYETYAEFANPSIQCERLVLTSDNQFSSIGNTIPLSEEYYYKEVDMIVKGGNANVKSTFKYLKRASMDGDLQVRPDEELHYKNQSNTYSLIQKTKYTYEGTNSFEDDEDFVKQYAVLPSHLQSYWDYGVEDEWCATIFMGTAKSLPRFQTIIRTKEKTVSEYTADSLVVATKYSYGSNHQMPLTIKIADSKGDTLERKIYYPTERASITSPSLSSGQLIILDSMVNRNMIEFIVAQELRRDGSLTDGTRTHYDFYNSRYYLPKETYDREKDGDYIRKINYLEYDTSGNILGYKVENNIETQFIWDYNKTYPIAQIVNASAADVAYTSFEADGKGNWSFTGAVTPGASLPTGTKYYAISAGNITKSGLQSGTTYVITYWRKDGTGTITVNSASGSLQITRNGWSLYRHQLSGVTSVTVSGSGDIDELRLHPLAAQMATNTYQPLIGVTSKADANNQISYFEYDVNNRLTIVKDQERKVIRKICYNYWGQAENCNECVNTTANWQNTNEYDCQKDGSNNNTGYQRRKQVDMNPCSSTYGSFQWVVSSYNTTACPLPPSCTFGNCNALGPDKRCINGVCETGVKVYTSSTYDPWTGLYECTYHYEWSDESWSHDYVEYNIGDCPIF